jgi:hydroxylamine dehydrogenase
MLYLQFWELQAPLTVRPEDFKPFPAQTNWKEERTKMQEVCLQYHGKQWTESHYAQMDQTIKEYNEVYFKPAKAENYPNATGDKTKPPELFK